MHPYRAPIAAPDALRLARAFLALGDDAAPPGPARQSLARIVVALVAVVALALSAPLTWNAPTRTSPTKLGEQPAATLANSKALLAAQDEDEDGAD
jgi:hypothetical protein